MAARKIKTKKKKSQKVFKKRKTSLFFYVLLFSFVFIVSVTFTVNSVVQVLHEPVYEEEEVVAKENTDLPPTPIYIGTPDFPLLSAQAVIAVDLDSGVTLYEKNPDLKLLPASTTKIVTSLVALDYYPLEEVLKVQKVNVVGQKMRLVPGEEITAKDLLYGLLVYSANDAAEVLAENYPGGREVFITAMNLKAEELQLENTNFSNPSGLETNNHSTTARDLVKVAKHAMQNPIFAEIVSTKEKTVKSVNGEITHKLVNINELLGEVEGVLGVKTGWTENARENLVTYIKRGERNVMIVVLGSQDRFGETKELISWIFKNYSWQVKLDG